MINSCTVITKDVNIAEQIFGPDIGALKVNTTIHTPKQVRDNTIDIPPEIREIHKDIPF